MTKPSNLFLIGLMGAGKSTIGRQLAKSLGCEFIDSDHEIEARTGANIPLIFDVEGEAGFRQREKKVIDDLTRREHIVLATGGGVVLDADNRAHLRARGFVVFLSATVDQLLGRAAGGRGGARRGAGGRGARGGGRRAGRGPRGRGGAGRV